MDYVTICHRSGTARWPRIQPEHGPLAISSSRGRESVGRGNLPSLRVGQRREAEFLDQFQVFLDQRERVARGLSGFLRRQATVTTQLDPPETLDIVFNLLRAVVGLLGNLAGRLLFHQALVADDRLVG